MVVTSLSFCSGEVSAGSVLNYDRMALRVLISFLKSVVSLREGCDWLMSLALRDSIVLMLPLMLSASF